MGMSHGETFDHDKPTIYLAKYVDQLIPPGTAPPREEAALGQLQALSPGHSTPGNTIAMHRYGIIVHRSSYELPINRFSTLHQSVTPKAHAASSERMLTLADPPQALGPALTSPFPPRETI
ncbi:hypothetical protein AB0E08_35550 [Streptomyces sp. NPDC048281]|uniref:hypothetical protein n=1 Tax=Streptomyces sp. NPDC048281 TaxID=3154715 RepID=UPI0034295F64